MNSRNSIIRMIKTLIIGASIVGLLVLGCTAQRVDPRSEGQHYGEPGFKGEPINLNVVNADIRDILNYITDQYGINFVLDKSVGSVPVTVKVSDVPWNVALESVLESQALGIQVKGNILRVADSKTLNEEIANQIALRDNVIDTSPLVTELIRLNFATVSGGATAAATTSGTSVSGPSASSAPAGGAGAAGGSSGLMPIIKKRLSRRGAIEIDPRTNSLIITDVPANVAAIKQLIAILDTPEPQVEIEARIVVASRNFSRDIGVQLAGLVLGSHGSGIQGGTLPTTGAPANLPGGNPNGDLVSKIANTVIGLTTGTIGTAQISALISLGEQKGEAKVIATPRVTALNNKPAEIKSGTQIPITTVQPGTTTGGAVIATTTYVDVPLRLAITPQITDVGAVILTVTAENSSTATIVGAAAPAINTQSMQTTVTVPDGGTTVVGGVLFDDERENQDRTPGVSSIPIIGNLFKRKGVQRNTNEILFFITPRISRPDYASAQSGSPRNPVIIQPVPMGNPPSNSQPPVETPQPILLQSPALARPEAMPATSATPAKQ